MSKPLMRYKNNSHEDKVCIYIIFLQTPYVKLRTEKNIQQQLCELSLSNVYANRQILNAHAKRCDQILEIVPVPRFFHAVTEAVSKLCIRTSGDPWIVFQNTFITMGVR